MNKPKHQIKSNSPLKLGLLAVSHAAGFSKTSPAINSYIKYPAFVGVCKNEGQGFTENFYVGQKWMCYLFSKLK